MLTPAEEQALQAERLALTLPPGTSASGQTPEQVRTMQETQAQIAADQGGYQPAAGMVMNPTTGLPMPTEMTQVTSPVQNVTQATKQLDPLAKEANEKVEAARKAYTEAANMTIPAEKVQPYMDPQEFAAMTAAGKSTVNAGEFADIQGRYQAKLMAEADAKEKRDQAERDRQRETRMRHAMAEAEARWSEVAKKASPAEMFAEPSIGAKIGQAIALGLSTYAHIRMGHSGPSPVQLMIQQQLDRDYGQRKAALQASVDAAEKAGAKPAQILAMMKLEEEVQKERRITQQKWIANQAENMAKAFPTKDREARMIQAQYEQKAAEDSLKLFADKLTEEKRIEDEGRKVVHTTTEKPEDLNAGKPPAPTEAEARAAKYAMRMKFGIDEIDRSPPLTRNDYKLLTSNVMAIKAQAENATKGLSGPMRVEALKALGLTPESLLSGIPDNRRPGALGWLVASGLVIRDESGAAINVDENINNAMKGIPQYDDGPKTVDVKKRMLRDNFDIQMKSAGPEAYYRMLGRYPEGYDERGRKVIGRSQNAAVQGAPGAAPMNIRTRWRDLTDAQRADVVEAVRIQADPKSSPAAKRGAASMLEQVKVAQ